MAGCTLAFCLQAVPSLPPSVDWELCVGEGLWPSVSSDGTVTGHVPVMTP